MPDQPDFFGESHPVQIRDNAVLERACNRLLSMVKENPELLNGDTIGDINRRIYAELLWEDSFKGLIAESKKSVFVGAMMKSPNMEVYTRAFREILSRDLVRISAKAIKSSEQYRARIAGSMR